MNFGRLTEQFGLEGNCWKMAAAGGIAFVMSGPQKRPRRSKASTAEAKMEGHGSGRRCEENPAPAEAQKRTEKAQKRRDIAGAREASQKRKSFRRCDGRLEMAFAEARFLLAKASTQVRKFVRRCETGQNVKDQKWSFRHFSI